MTSFRCGQPESPVFFFGWIKKPFYFIALTQCSFGFSCVVMFFWPLHRFLSYKRESQEEITHRLSRLISSQDPEAKPRLHSPQVNIQLLVIGTWFKGKSHWAKHFGFVLRICTIFPPTLCSLHMTNGILVRAGGNKWDTMCCTQTRRRLENVGILADDYVQSNTLNQARTHSQQNSAGKVCRK